MLVPRESEFYDAIAKWEQLRKQYIQENIGNIKSKITDYVKKYVNDTLELPVLPYRPIIIGSCVIWVVAGWTVLIWMPWGVIIFPISTIKWAKNREAKKRLEA